MTDLGKSINRRGALFGCFLWSGPRDLTSESRDLGKCASLQRTSCVILGAHSPLSGSVNSVKWEWQALPWCSCSSQVQKVVRSQPGDHFKPGSPARAVMPFTSPCSRAAPRLLQPLTQTRSVPSTPPLPSPLPGSAAPSPGRHRSWRSLQPARRRAPENATVAAILEVGTPPTAMQWQRWVATSARPSAAGVSSSRERREVWSRRMQRSWERAQGGRWALFWWSVSSIVPNSPLPTHSLLYIGSFPISRPVLRRKRGRGHLPEDHSWVSPGGIRCEGPGWPCLPRGPWSGGFGPFRAALSPAQPDPAWGPGDSAQLGTGRSESETHFC